MKEESQSLLEEAQRSLEAMGNNPWAVHDGLNAIYSTLSGEDVSDDQGYIGGKKARVVSNPIFRSSVALMIEDVLERAFLAISSDRQKWQMIEQLMSKDEHVALAAMIDVLLGVAHTLPIATVSALLFKIGARKAFGISVDGPKFDKSAFGRLAAKALGQNALDQFDLSLYAARLHRAVGQPDLCRKRLETCEELCRQREELTNLNSVAYEYVELGEFETARGLLEEVASTSRDDPGVLDSIAWLEFKTGRVAEAAENMRQLVEREAEIISEYTMDGMAEMLYHAVLIFQAIGDNLMATRMRERLHQLDHARHWIDKLPDTKVGDAL